jgi:glycosyltransferase involved in cell wall biosynthesis
MAHEQGKALKRMGHEVSAFVGRLHTSPLPDLPRHARSDDMFEGLRVHRINTAPEDYSPEFLNFLHPTVDSHFRDVLREFRPDVVHFHNLTGLSVKLPILARQVGARTICTLHDFWGFCLRNTAVRADGRPCDDVSQCRSCLPRIHDGQRLHIPMRFRKDFMRLALDHVDHFIAPSRFVAAAYERAGFAADRIAVVPNGIDVMRFHPAPTIASATSPLRIVFAGHFGAHKGVSTLLEAITLLPALLPPGTPPAELRLAGEGPQEEAYRAQIAASGLAEQVRFLGKVMPADMPAVYAASDLLVLPSIWDENQPVCLMEAMAAGLPVIASRKGGIPELIEHGRNGMMFAPEDAHDLAAQLARCISNPAWRYEAGRDGRRRVENLDHDRQAERLSLLYIKVISALSLPASLPRIHAALGPMRRPMSGEAKALADDRRPDRHFMPRAWIKDVYPALAGIVLTGRAWSALQSFGVDGLLTFPRRLLSRPAKRSPERASGRTNSPPS